LTPYVIQFTFGPQKVMQRTVHDTQATAVASPEPDDGRDQALTKAAACTINPE